ncbi:ABC transporter ATP-binding protein [Chloroflexota bacterium]
MELRIEALSVQYGHVQAVNKVSLKVPDKGIVALIGANGAGKSTVLRAISRLVPTASGDIWIGDNRITKLPAYKVASMGLSHIPEGRALFYRMTVIENLLMGTYLERNGQVVEQALKQVFEYFPILGQRQKQRAGSMSGGEQQMLAIARALMSSPKILILDEPSLGLAPIVIQRIGNTIRDINSTGVGILLAEQNARLALSLAQYGYVMETGEVALEGTTEELMNKDEVRKAYLGI